MVGGACMDDGWVMRACMRVACVSAECMNARWMGIGGGKNWVVVIMVEWWLGGG